MSSGGIVLDSLAYTLWSTTSITFDFQHRRPGSVTSALTHTGLSPPINQSSLSHWVIHNTHVRVHVFF